MQGKREREREKTQMKNESAVILKENNSIGLTSNQSFQNYPQIFLSLLDKYIDYYEIFITDDSSHLVLIFIISFLLQIKLFKQWNRKWPIEFKAKLQQKITEIDSKVGEKMIMALKGKVDGSLTNGYASDEQKNTEQLIENDDENVNTESNSAEGLFTVALNDPMTEVLNNETSVDDIETNEEVNNVNEQPLLRNIVTTTATTSCISNDNIPVVGSVNNDNIACSTTIHNHAINDRGEPVEQVVQIQNLQINEENEEADKDQEDVTTEMEQTQQQQQPLPTVTVTVNPVVVTQTLTTNAEVPLVV